MANSSGFATEIPFTDRNIQPKMFHQQTTYPRVGGSIRPGHHSIQFLPPRSPGSRSCRARLAIPSAPQSQSFPTPLGTARGAPLVTLKWSGVDLEARWITSPGETTKSGRAHELPIVDELHSILTSLRDFTSTSEYVFASWHVDNDQPIVFTSKPTKAALSHHRRCRRTRKAHPCRI